MSNYTPIVDFAAKDALLTGNPSKKILGTEFSAELDAIDTAIQSKEDTANKNQSNGYCGLDNSAVVPDARIPANILRTDAASSTITGNLNVTGTLQMNSSTVWTAANDGASSGLNADLLDGQEGAYYLAASSYTAADILSKLLTVDGPSSGLDADLLDGNSSAYFATAAHNHDGTYEPADAAIVKSDEAETVTANWTFSGTVNYSGTLQYGGIEVGYRVIPRLSGSGGTADTSWRGKAYATSGGVTLPANTFAAGDAIMIYNNTASPVTITRGASLVMYYGGTDSATFSLPARTRISIWYNTATECVLG